VNSEFMPHASFDPAPLPPYSAAMSVVATACFDVSYDDRLHTR